MTPFEPPVLQSFAGLVLSSLVITWNTTPNQWYQLQFKANLDWANWDVVTNLTAAGQRLYFTNALPTANGQGYYRVLTR